MGAAAIGLNPRSMQKLDSPFALPGEAAYKVSRFERHIRGQREVTEPIVAADHADVLSTPGRVKIFLNAMVDTDNWCAAAKRQSSGSNLSGSGLFCSPL